MSYLLHHLLIIALAVAGSMLVVRCVAPPADHAPHRLTIEQIQPLTALLTTRVHLAEAVVEQLDGYTGKLRMAAVIHGDVLIRVDLAGAELRDLDEKARTATLVLPGPDVLSPRIDHERSRVVAVYTSGLWQITPTDAGRAKLFDRTMSGAQRRIAGAGAEEEMIEQARQRAQQLICDFAADVLGWHITVRWHPPTHTR